MARENQGLQIALIVLVMLTIILGVTSFIFFRQYEEASQKYDDEQKKAFDSGQASKNLADECTELKRLMGFASDQTEMKLDQITPEFDRDMETYCGINFPKEKRTYHDVLAYLYQTIQDKNSELDEVKANLQKLNDKYEVREASKDPQIKQFEERAETAEANLATVTATAKTDRTNITNAQEALQKERDKDRTQAAAKLTAMEKQRDKVVGDLDTQRMLNTRLADEIVVLTKPTFETPDGEVRFVDQHKGTVYINLGWGDSLARQTTFSVYPADVSNLAKATVKADIEVTEVLAEHLAEARITKDVATDPIMPGDKINTPLWSPGEKKHFALTGFMDLDEDGKSDQQTVRNLIASNGGVVDCWPDETGKIHGQMTFDTRYLVLGADPSEVRGVDAKNQSALIKAHTKMTKDAEKLGIQKITLGELLQQMGWVNQAPVVTFGRGANPKDFRAKPPGGVNPVSSGNVSELFQPRRPPAPKPRSGGAY
jgi:hypothetical protein